MVLDATRMTSPDNVVLLPYMKEMRNLVVLMLRLDEEIHSRTEFST